jgi:hypothetical protein
MVIPAAMEASRIPRRVSMVFSLVRLCALIFEAVEENSTLPFKARHVFAEVGSRGFAVLMAYAIHARRGVFGFDYPRIWIIRFTGQRLMQDRSATWQG